MKSLLQVVSGILIVLLGIFAITDAYRSGVSYATAVLAVAAAVLAMLTLFTAPDAPRFHRQLDNIYEELKKQRESPRNAIGQISSNEDSELRNMRHRPSRRPTLFAMIIVIAAAYVLWCRRRKISRTREN